ncbi:MAG: hypothetical protein IPG00_05260 [Saprospiraceae bacterium]|nr:hypothetical protein [Saprospiraceae bacterium]
MVPEAGVGLPVPHQKNPEEFATNLYDMVWHHLLSEVGIVELSATINTIFISGNMNTMD